MSSKSGLDIVGLPNLFQSISNDMKTGTLKVQSDLGEKYVYFRKGDIQQVSSPQKPSILAEGLKRHPGLDEESYQEMCAQQKSTGKSMASLLLEEAEEGKQLVIEVCQFQILEEICELFTWEDCHCEFEEGDPQAMLFDMEILDIDMAMNTGMVLLEAARRYDEWKIILEIIPSKADIPEGKEEVKQELEEDEAAVLSLIDGFRDVEEILDQVRLSPFVAMKAIANLLQQGNIAFRTGPDLARMAKLDIFRENKYKAIKLYERAEELGEKSAEITLWLARSYEAMGMKDKAAKQYLELGYHYLDSKVYHKAANSFEMVTHLTPDNFDAQERLITLLPKMSRLENYSETTTNYSRWLALRGDRRRAIVLLRESIARVPDNLSGLDLLGNLYREEGERQNAIDTFRSLADKVSDSENREASIGAYEKIISMDQDNLEARKEVAEIYHEVGKNQEAMDYYLAIGHKISGKDKIDKKSIELLVNVSRKIIEIDQSNLIAREWLAKAYIQQNKNDLAIEHLEELLTKANDNTELNLVIEALKDLTALKPLDFENRLRLAESYLKVKREREAVQELFNLGTTAAKNNDISQALKAFDRLLSYEPSNYATRLKKAEILENERDLLQAMDELMLTGYLSMGADKLWQAVKAFRKVLSLDRNSNIICYFELGKVYEKLGKNKEAIAAYKKHVQKNVKRSNFGDALTSCDCILRLDPDNKWAKVAQDKLNNIMPSINELFQNSVSK